MTSQKMTENKVKIPKTITVKKLGEVLHLPISKIITELLKNNIVASINEEIDYETASIIAQDFGFQTEEDLEELEKGSITLEQLIEICQKEKGQKSELKPRPAVVTILGHV